MSNFKPVSRSRLVAELEGRAKVKYRHKRTAGGRERSTAKLIVEEGVPMVRHRGTLHELAAIWLQYSKGSTPVVYDLHIKEPS